MKKQTKTDFKKSLSTQTLKSIDDDKTFRNLPKGYWVYDELLRCLRNEGWIRFAPGFKAGVYGHINSDFCIKILGMGVGDNPMYFCEKGEYIWHERRMIEDFHKSNFNFLPKVLSISDSIEFLKKECGIDEEQAYLRCTNNDLLIMEYINGIPLATQTGHYLDYILNIEQFDNSVIIEMGESLLDLKQSLNEANRVGLLHNDPMPPNIIFTFDGNSIVAKLVDFELAQNLNKESPHFVNKSVEELYYERDVPFNDMTKKYKNNLDQHLIDGSINALKTFPFLLSMNEEYSSVWDGISVSIPFVGGPSFNIGIIKKAAGA